MPTQPHFPTLSEVVKRACEVADPSGADDRVTELMTRFEDRDEPVTAVLEEVEEQLLEARRIIDPDGDSDALRTAVAVAIYLSFRRDQLADDADELIRRASKAEDVD
jgi:hypothetical protein